MGIDDKAVNLSLKHHSFVCIGSPSHLLNLWRTEAFVSKIPPSTIQSGLKWLPGPVEPVTMPHTSCPESPEFMTVQINELYTWPEIKPGPLYSNSEVWGKIWPVRICVHFALMRGRAKRFWLYNPTPWGVIISKLQTRNWLLPESHCPGPRLNCLGAGGLFLWLQMADPSLARWTKEEERPELSCQLQRGHRNFKRPSAQSEVHPVSHPRDWGGRDLGSELHFLAFKLKHLGTAGRLWESFKQEPPTPKLPLQTYSLTRQLSSLQKWVT